MIPSEASRISAKAVTAAGFSIFDRIAARPLASSRASITSSARCTKLSASQSTPSSQANSRSLRSFLDSAASGRITSGTLTPLRFEISPPTITSVSAWLSEHSSTFSRILPSLTSRVDPGSSAAKISGCGRFTRVASPSAASRSSRNRAPASSIAGPPANTPQRSLGPCRSARIAIGRPTSSSTCRIRSWRRAMSAWVPWLMLSRNTSAPARNSARIISIVSEAGPRVATILTLRWRRVGVMGGFSVAVAPAPVIAERPPLGTSNAERSRKCPRALAPRAPAA